MTMEPEVSSENKFVRATLPWLIAAGALLLYLLTLNHWVCLTSLGPVAQLSGWIWQPNLTNPLYWLLTAPLQWLPAKLIPLALNGFAALCAVLTLALLARSVALLPHNRTEDQRTRQAGANSLLSIRLAWLPPLLAVLVCGLQLTFWEHATAASSEMLDLLLFAYIVRSVLEFRLDRRDAWLLRAALVYGLAMTNNWAMIGFFPAFAIALIWVKGLKLFNLAFLGRMLLCGLAGLTLYLLLPLVASLSHTVHISFWQALKANLASQKQLLVTLPLNKTALVHGFDGRPLWVLALPSLLPVLVMGIRWPSYFGDPSKLGVALTTFIFHVVHAVLLLVCIWVTLDPQSFSPRHLVPLPLLTFYYLGALSVGYFAGYFLLIFGTRPITRMGRRTMPSYWAPINYAVIGFIWVLAVVAPALLLYKNLPQIRTTNGPLLKQYAAQVAASLPPQGAILLSDDPRRLLLLQSALTQSGKAKDYLFLDTASLTYPDYHRFLKKHYPQRWPIDLPKDFQQQIDSSDLLASLSYSNSLYYLHPSFGAYFELLYPEPHGMVYKLTAYPPHSLLAPPLSKHLLAQNEAFWNQAEREILEPLSAAVTLPAKRKQRPLDRWLSQVHLPNDPNADAALLASFYSRALDFWGVQLQKADQFAQAATRFERALDLNPDNLVAQINLDYNTTFRTNHQTSVPLTKSIEDQFGKYRNWDQIVGANGPFDEPSFCYEQGRAFARSGNYRQAAQEFTRVKTLAPDNLSARLYLAQLSLMRQMPDAALQEVKTIQSNFAAACQTNFVELVSIQTLAHLAKNDPDSATAVVQAALATYPTNTDVMATLANAYMSFNYFTNALEMLDRQLKVQPNNPEALVNKGFVCLQMNACEQAIVSLNRALSLITNTTSEAYYRALFDRAIAYFRSEKLDQAQQDYEVLQKAFPKAYQVYFGLGEIAFRRKDNATAIKNYELYLTHAPTSTPEATNVLARLQELKHGAS